MIRFKIPLALVGLASLGTLAYLVVAASGEPKPVRKEMDLRKGQIERPLKAVLAARSATATTFVNPKVQPGKVRWHADLATARAAAAQSKKPVLLFQMMGKLDQHFC